MQQSKQMQRQFIISNRKNTKIKNEIISTSRRISKKKSAFKNNDKQGFNSPKFTRRKSFSEDVNFYTLDSFDFIKFFIYLKSKHFKS